jgi:hypothetical protein
MSDETCHADVEYARKHVGYNERKPVMKQMQRTSMSTPATDAQIAFARIATAFALLSVGALAIGRVAIWALAIKTGKIGHLSISELEVGRLHVRELIVDREN